MKPGKAGQTYARSALPLVLLLILGQWPVAAGLAALMDSGIPGSDAVATLAALGAMGLILLLWRRWLPSSFIMIAVTMLSASHFLAFRHARIQVFELLSGISFAFSAVYLLGTRHRRLAGLSCSVVSLALILALVDTAGPYFKSKGYRARQDGRLLVEDSIVWARHIPEAICRYTVTDDDDGVEFDVTYHIERDGSRVVPGRPSAGPRWYMFGGSYTFGEGVQDSETIPAILQRMNTRSRVLNHGVRGFGPGEVYFHMREKLHEATDIRLCAYFVILDHFRRAGCPDSLTTGGIGAGKPRFELRNGALEYLGSASETLELPRRINVNLLRRSWIYRTAYGPWALTIRDQELTEALILGMKESCDLLPKCRFLPVLLLEKSEAQEGQPADLSNWIGRL